MRFFPRQLSAGAEATVVALSESEAGKLFPDRHAAYAEAEKLEMANSVNGLLVRLLRVDAYEPTDSAVLVLERLWPLDFRALERDTRRAFLEVFTDELEELHAAGFVHGHLHREPGFTSGPWDNILLTNNGLRLIDAGRSVLRGTVPEPAFDDAVRAEHAAMDAFSAYFLDR